MKKLVCSGVQNLHCSQQDCPHHAEHVHDNTCEQTFCSLKRTSCYCYEPQAEPPTTKRATKPVNKPTTQQLNELTFKEKLALLLGTKRS